MKRITYIILCLTILSSCSDFLEQEPGSQTSVNEIFSSPEGFYLSLAGSYEQLEDIMSSKNDILYADLLGGNLSFTPKDGSSNSGLISIDQSIENIYSFNDDSRSSDMASTYSNYYKLINSVNNILEYIDPFNGFTLDEKNQIKAEALCIRAFAHSQLLRLYAQNYAYTTDASHPGIVINQTLLKIGEDFPSRSSIKESYQLVIDDYVLALSLFTESNVFEGPAYIYFGKTAALALLARTYLYANNWQKAIDYADETLSVSGLALTPKEDYIAQWEAPDLAINETIMELYAPLGDDGSFATSNGASAPFRFQMFVTVDTLPNDSVKIDTSFDYGDYCATKDLLALYSDSDIRRNDMMFIPVKLKTISSIDTFYTTYSFTKKLQDNAGVNIIRLSELYLIKAEAYARLQKPALAIVNLNSIRERAGLLPLDSDLNLMDEIFDERRRELCFEGHLFLDYARFKKNVTRADGCYALTCNLSYPSPYFILPIPNSNITINSNMVQNEGY